jgi:hypothetical protein
MKERNPFPVNRDLLLIIRDYVANYTFQRDGSSDSDSEMEYFGTLEDQRTWRNFLSIQNSVQWKDMRKQCMMYTLSRYWTRIYLEKTEFRINLLEKLTDPYHQLCLNLEKFSNADFNPEYTRYLSNIYSLKISRCKLLEIIPVIQHVYQVDLSDSYPLASIDQLSDVKKLNLCDCVSLTTLGFSLHNVEALNLLIFGSPIVFPLSNQLTELTLSINSIDPGFDFNSLVNLVSFTLVIDDRDETLQIPPLSLPELQRFNCQGFVLTDISGLPRLIHFQLWHSLVKKGKEIIYPNLISFVCTRQSYEREDLQYFKNLRKLEVYFSSFIPNTEELLQLPKLQEISFPQTRNLTEITVNGSRVKFMNFHFSRLETINGLLPQEHYQKINLANTLVGTSIFYSFRNVTKLLLDGSVSVIDLYHFQEIPYLSLAGCSKLGGFQYLRGKKQKYINLSKFDGLHNEDLHYLKDVFYLNISYCPWITDLSMIETTVYLTANSCKKVEEFIWNGTAALKVELYDCPLLQFTKIIGRIHILYLTMGKGIGKIENPERIDEIRHY